MTNTQSAFAARPIDEVKRELLERAQENRNPFLHTIFQEVLPVITGLRSVDREEWANAFGALAAPHEERAAQAFQKDWIVNAQRGEYPFELAETLACAFGRSTAQEWVEYAPNLSLIDQGILDKPCAPLLCVNGVNDSVFPIADMYLLLEYGSPKAARFYPGGHMGGGDAQAVIVQWLKEKLS